MGSTPTRRTKLLKSINKFGNAKTYLYLCIVMIKLVVFIVLLFIASTIILGVRKMLVKENEDKKARNEFVRDLDNLAEIIKEKEKNQ